MDNQDTQTQDNVQTQTQDTQTQQTQQTQTQTAAFSWKGQLPTDLANSPLLQKFSDDAAGLAEGFKSHSSLEQLLGHEKVPIPKGKDDVEGWNRFSKAMGIPDKAELYGLPDAQFPDGVKNVVFDKNKFAEVMHGYKLTPDQAKGMWDTYTKMIAENYQNLVKQHEDLMANVVNQMRSEWGDAYDTNVELGQLVINKFASSAKDEAFLTAVLSKDPRGIKFLAKLGNQFAENKMGDFAFKRFSLTPEQMEAEIAEIKKDMNGPYWNPNNKFSEKEHNSAVERVIHLQNLVNKARGQA